MIATGSTGEAISRWRLPDALPAPRRGMYVATWIWWPIALIALLCSIGGLWRAHIDIYFAGERLAAIGLIYDDSADSPGRVHVRDENERRTGIEGTQTVIAVDGRVPADLSAEAIARQLNVKRPASVVRLRADDGQVRDFTLPRSDSLRREVVGPGGSWATIASFELPLFGAVIVLLIAGGLLLRSRPGDPVAILLAYNFAVAALALPLTARFTSWAGIPLSNDAMTGAFFALFMLTLPAFPDGRFVPRWGVLVAMLGPVIFLITASEMFGMGVSVITAMGGALAAVAALLVRYRRTPPGLDRQQLKWAGFGFFGWVSGMIGALALALMAGAGLFPAGIMPYLALVFRALMAASFLMLPLGLVLSVLRIRLWDADLAIGRSAAIVILTLLIGGVWAAITTVLNELLSSAFGDLGKPAVAAVSAVIAGIVLGPARERVNNWVEARFQGQLRRLRALPERLSVWQHRDTVDVLAARVAALLRETLHARYVAIDVADTHGRLRPAAAVGEESERAVITRDWTDDGMAIGRLRIGPRSDGSGLARDERDTIAGFDTALAAAIAQAQRHSAQEARLKMLIDGLQAPAASRLRTSSMNRITEIGLET